MVGLAVARSGHKSAHDCLCLNRFRLGRRRSRRRGASPFRVRIGRLKLLRQRDLPSARLPELSARLLELLLQVFPVLIRRRNKRHWLNKQCSGRPLRVLRRGQHLADHGHLLCLTRVDLRLQVSDYGLHCLPFREACANAVRRARRHRKCRCRYFCVGVLRLTGGWRVEPHARALEVSWSRAPGVLERPKWVHGEGTLGGLHSSSHRSTTRSARTAHIPSTAEKAQIDRRAA